jgi:hypothetical protein
MSGRARVLGGILVAVAIALALGLALLLRGGDSDDGSKEETADRDAGIVLTPGRGNSFPADAQIYDGGRLAVAAATWDGKRWGTTLVRLDPSGGEEASLPLAVGQPVAIAPTAGDALLVLGAGPNGKPAMTRVQPDGDRGVQVVGEGLPIDLASSPAGDSAVALRGGATEVIRIAADGSANDPVPIEVPGASDSETRIVALGTTAAGGIVAAGEVLEDGGASGRPFVARFDGAAVAGVAVAPDAPPVARWKHLAVHPDGFVTVAGDARVDGRAVIATARFAPDGSPGTTTTATFGRGDAFTGALAPAPDGGVYVATNSDDKAQLVHLRKDGSLDPGFRRPSVPGRATAVTLEDGGSVILVTSVWVKSRQTIGLRRLQGLG